jgi:hypothetical protein
VEQSNLTITEVPPDGKPDYANTYWCQKGKHEALDKELRKLVPSSGEVENADSNPALEKYRVASNCYYDLYNNGLCNRGEEFKKTFGFDAFESGVRRINPRWDGEDEDAKYSGYIDLTQKLIDRTERKMDAIIVAAAHEQHIGEVVTGTVDITPVGMTSPEGANRVAKALREFDSASASVANMATAFIKEWDWYFKPGKGAIDRETRGQFATALSDLKHEITIRERTQEAFLRAVAGK